MKNISNFYSESKSNKYTVKCLVVSVLLLYATWILNILNIFIIESSIYIVAVVGCTIITAIALTLNFILDVSKPYVKYIFLTLAVAFYTFATSCLTYHTTLALIFPLIYSAQYRSKRVLWYTYGLSAVAVVLSVVGGYLYGLCDANMVLFTAQSVESFISSFDSIILPDTTNWFNIILFFALPKILVILGAVPMIFHLNTVIDKGTENLLITQKHNLDLSKQIVSNQQKVIVSLASIVESRDQITGDHIKNTAKYVQFLIAKIKEANLFSDELPDEYANLIIQAAPLHDIGKIHIPDSILCKNGKLTAEEYAEMKNHPLYGYNLLCQFVEDDINGDYLAVAKDLCLYHHERYDGNGYPNKLVGEDIPLCARIMSVADVLDALLSKRSYKEGYSFEKTFQILNEEKGKQFDPIVLSALIDNWEEFKTDIYPEI